MHIHMYIECVYIVDYIYITLKKKNLYEICIYMFLYTFVFIYTYVFIWILYACVIFLLYFLNKIK